MDYRGFHVGNHVIVSIHFDDRVYSAETTIMQLSPKIIVGTGDFGLMLDEISGIPLTGDRLSSLGFEYVESFQIWALEMMEIDLSSGKCLFEDKFKNFYAVQVSNVHEVQNLCRLMKDGMNG